MKIVLDECLPKGLKRYCSEYNVSTVREMGWAGITNGKLLQTMSDAQIDVFITIDKNLRYQQNVHLLPFAVIVLDAYSNRLPDILPLVPALQDALKNVQQGTVTEIQAHS